MKGLKRLKDGASGRLKGLAGKAKQLEGVLNDLKTRDFMQSPKIQELMAKVTVKGLNSVPYISRAASKRSGKKGKSKKGDSTTESAFRGRLKALENQISPQVARNLIQTIMKRADEIKKSYWDTPKSESNSTTGSGTTRKSATSGRGTRKSATATGASKSANRRKSAAGSRVRKSEVGIGSRSSKSSARGARSR